MENVSLSALLRTRLEERHCRVVLIFRIEGLQNYLAVQFLHQRQMHRVAFEIPDSVNWTASQIDEMFYNAVMEAVNEILKLESPNAPTD